MFTTAAALLVQLPTSGFAQVANAALAPDQARMSAAEDYYAAADYETDAKIYVDAAVTQYAKAVAQRGGKSDSDTERKVEELIRPDFQGLIQSKHQHMVELFAEYFSAEDLREVVKWIHTPLGMKFTKAKSDIVRQIYADSHADIQPVRVKVWTTHLADFEKLGLVFPGVKQK